MPRIKTPGQSLIDDLSLPGDPYALTIVIIEAARIADRLEKLDRIVSGDEDTWMRLCAGRDDVVEVRIDSALSEARQQATVLRHLIAEVRRHRAALPAEADDDDLAGL